MYLVSLSFVFELFLGGVSLLGLSRRDNLSILFRISLQIDVFFLFFLPTGFPRTLAIVPAQAKTMELADVTRVCFDYTINGITNMAAVANKTFRFIYTSGVAAERDQTKSPPMMGDYALMRVCNTLCLTCQTTSYKHGLQSSYSTPPSPPPTPTP